MKKTCLICLSVYAFVSAFFVSCKRIVVVSSIKRDDLFSLKYGNFENQLNFFDLSETGNDIHTELAMKDGFFYISNGESSLKNHIKRQSAPSARSIMRGRRNC